MSINLSSPKTGHTTGGSGRSPDAGHRWAVLEYPESIIHAEVDEVDLELVSGSIMPFAVARRTSGHGRMPSKTSLGRVS